MNNISGISHISYISDAYLGNISSISQAYLRISWAFLKIHLGQIFGISLANLQHLFGISLVPFGYIWLKITRMGIPNWPKSPKRFNSRTSHMVIFYQNCTGFPAFAQKLRQIISNSMLGLSWAKLSPSWVLTVSKIYYIEFINKIRSSSLYKSILPSQISLSLINFTIVKHGQMKSGILLNSRIVQNSIM